MFYYRLAFRRHGLAIVRQRLRQYSLTMMPCTKSVVPDARSRKGNEVMKKALSCVYVLLVLAGAAWAGDLPDAPSSTMTADPAIVVTAPATSLKGSTSIVGEGKVVDEKFIALAVISSASTFADSYTTLFARQNWLAGKQGVCNAEVQSAYLYGTHPTVGRAYAVASVKSLGSIAASYYLRKHHSKLWSLPLVANSLLSLQGTTQNMVMCN